MKSIRRSLSIWLVAAVMLMCAAAGAFCYVRARHVLAVEFDRSLLSRADALTALVHLEPDGKLAVTEAAGAAADFAAVQHPSYMQICDASGRTLQRSQSLGRNDIAAPSSPERILFWDLVLPDGRPGRAVRIRFQPRMEAEDPLASTPPALSSTVPAVHATTAPTSEVSLVVMRDLAPVDRVERVVLGSLLLATGALCVGVLVSVPLVVRYGLATLRKLGERAVGIDASTLGQRFDEAEMPDELRPICYRLNDLLGRLDDAFNRERRFTGNVAHELRTPISELRALAEVSLRWPGDSASAALGYREVLGIARRMESVVSALLALARADAGKSWATLHPCNLVETVVSSWQAIARRSIAKQVRLQLRKPQDDVIVSSDPVLLRTMIDNLLMNAVEYSPPATRVGCVIEPDGEGSTILLVSNPAGAISRADAELSLEPFWRKDTAGTDSIHAGLGLSLVAAYAKATDSEFSVEVTADHQFCAKLRLKRLLTRTSTQNQTVAAIH
jgi:two-component system sensor histidine kinase QseC